MESAIEINRRSGYPQWAAWYVAHLGWLARLRGRDGEAVSLGRRALQPLRGERPPLGQCVRVRDARPTLLAAGSRAEAIELFERGHAIAEKDGAEAYLLHCLGPLAEATLSPAVLAEADRLLAGARLPAGDAWVLGYEVYLSVARAWLAAGQPERARAVLAPAAGRGRTGAVGTCARGGLGGGRRGAWPPRRALPGRGRRLDRGADLAQRPWPGARPARGARRAEPGQRSSAR